MEDLLTTFGIIFQPLLLLQMLVGVILGIIFGIIPGLTATLAVVLLIPITYGMDAVSGVAILVGVYIGGVSGGLVSAILIGMPGTPASIPTVFDGFPMAKQGKANKALGMGIFANLFGTLVSWIFLVTLAPQLAKVALAFGPFEFVSVIIFGLITVISLSGDSLGKGVVACVFGLVVCTIGSDPVFGVGRNTFGIEMLESGISAVPALIGLFVVAEVLRNVTEKGARIINSDLQVKGRGITLTDIRASWRNLVRSSLLGVGIGILPGIGGSLASIVAYDRQKKAAPDPETYGKGNIQGVVAPEAANNATIGGAMIPMMALGIPGDVVTAALIGGLMLHGLQPGPMLFIEHPVFVYGIYVAFLIAAIMMFLVMYLASDSILPKLLLVPKKYLLPLVLIACTVGCYNLNYSFTDMWVAVIFGVIGFAMTLLHFPLTPVIISLILGSTLEKELRLAMIISEGSLTPFFTRPVSLLFLVLGMLSLYFAMRSKKKAKHAK